MVELVNYIVVGMDRRQLMCVVRVLSDDSSRDCGSGKLMKDSELHDSIGRD